MIELKSVYKVVYIYLSLPLFIFLLGWTDYGWGILLSLLTALALLKVYIGISTMANKELTNTSASGVLLLLALIWCFLAGIGYFYYQSFDYHFRNAVFRDLINYEWPVFYDKADTPMVYYMAFWLFPATLAKLFAPLIQNEAVTFYIANVYLYIYASIGVLLILLLFSAAVKAKSTKQVLTAALIFIFFSGLDIIGIKFFRLYEQPFALHLDWWATFIQYSSFSTDLFWVFNQFIPIALITLLLYNERNLSHFGFLIALSLFYSPYPTAGTGVFAVAYAGWIFLREQDKKCFICTKILSVPNLIGVFWLLPLLILYYITNSEGMDKLFYIFSYTTPMRLIIFMLLEFLLYVVVIAPRYRHSLFFITAVISLCLIPFLRIDQQNNFCMRASIPALIILAVYVTRFLLESFQLKCCRFSCALLIILLLTGSVTPLTEFYRGMYFTHKEGRINLVADKIKTLNKSFVRMPVFGWDANHQYTAKTYKTDIFWQYIAHRNIPDNN